MKWLSSLVVVFFFSSLGWATEPNYRAIPSLGWSLDRVVDVTSLGDATGITVAATGLDCTGNFLTTDSNGNFICAGGAAGSGDITGVTAGSGLTGGGTTGDVTVDVGEGLAIDVAADSVALDPTELTGSRTWGDASTDTIVWTWDRTTGTDPTVTFGDATMTGQVVSASTGFEVNGERVTDWTGSGITLVGGALTSSGGSGNSFETIAVPAGASVVAESSTDTLTLTETSPLALTGTAATDTIDITVDAGADFDSSGLIEANAVALGTDTTNAYVATATEGLAIDVAGVGAETATLDIAFDPTELTGSRTFGDASTDTIVWTWNRTTGTDPTFTVGNNLFTVPSLEATTTVTGVVVVATSILQVPIGASPTVSAPSALAVDTTSGQLVVYDNTSGIIVPKELTKCVTIENAVAADDNVPIYVFEDAATMQRTACYTTGMTTNPTYQLEDANGNAVTGAATCTTNVTSVGWTTTSPGNTFTQAEVLRVDITNTPAPTTGTFTTICWVYQQNRT